MDAVIEDPEDIGIETLDDTRCSHCGEPWKVEKAEGHQASITIWQARCSNTHGCGLRGPRNHFWAQAVDLAEGLGLYYDVRNGEKRLERRVKELEEAARLRDERGAQAQLELTRVAIQLLKWRP